MANWPAMLVAPSLALANLSINYALVTPSCARQDRGVLNLVSAIVLIVCIVLTWQAWRSWWEQGALEKRASDDPVARGRFVALVAGMTGLLSCLVVAAMWLPEWFLSPCAN